ncbi:MAG TPA: crotonase/enoyl-CoA hydratase family protein [Gammaproteobacteria bacterium]|nr:crotonase/enoyl-CoA hydratase family protein [Gammaproteobacteria bacterium]
MSYEQILYAVDNGVLTLTLNRPERLNAFTDTMMKELIEAFDKADVDDAVRAIIVTGAGRGFCAGADLSGNKGAFDKTTDRMTLGDGGGRAARRIFRCLKPVIAAINGPAVGVGITMTLPMDIRLASDNAKMGFVFARRGIVPEACSTWFLPRIVGISQAAEWVYSGRVFSASEALAGGLVRSLHAPGDLLDVANGLAREIADNTSSVSVALSRQMLWRLLGEDDPVEAHRLDTLAVEFTRKSADAREGVDSFLEKRSPKFTNKVSEDMPPFFPWWEERDLDLG